MNQATTPILVTGGTGTLGRLVVPRLRDAGRRVRILSRSNHEPSDGIEFVTGDLTTGTGIEQAMDGIETILHLAGDPKGNEEQTSTLVRTALPAGIQHLVNISVVGADRVPVKSGIDRGMFGYFASKRAAEKVLTGSGLPWTNLRATQFHELILKVAQAMAKLPVIPAPSGIRLQPVDGGEVASRLVDLSLGEPSGLVHDMAGPREYYFADLVRGYLRASGRRKPILPVRLPGKAARSFRQGAALAPEQAVGRRTWEEFLTDHVGENGALQSA